MWSQSAKQSLMAKCGILVEIKDKALNAADTIRDANKLLEIAKEIKASTNSIYTRNAMIRAKMDLEKELEKLEVKAAKHQEQLNEAMNKVIIAKKKLWMARDTLKQYYDRIVKIEKVFQEIKSSPQDCL